MLLPAVVLDTSMTASAVLTRLAHYGFWVDATRPESRAFIEAAAETSGVEVDEAERRLARSPWRTGAALRRQVLAQVLWYARPLEEVLWRCHEAAPEAALLAVLDLHEANSTPPVPVTHDDTPTAHGVAVLGGVPVGVYLDLAMAAADDDTATGVVKGTHARRSTRGAVSDGEPEAVGAIKAWPRLEAPDYVPALTPFTVVVGLRFDPHPGVTGAEVVIPTPDGLEVIDVSVELVVEGLAAPTGLSRVLQVEVAEPTKATVSFELVGLEPDNAEGMRLTTIEARYLLGGTVCGSASRRLVVGRAGSTVAPQRMAIGTHWLDAPAAATTIVLARDNAPADLTIEIAKPDDDVSNGRYQVRLFSPHALPGLDRTFSLDLGQDARSFAEGVVRQVAAARTTIDRTMRGLGRRIWEKWPDGVRAAIYAAAEAVSPRVPAVLLVSRDPYVPWELAAMYPPLDATRPPFLGAQVILGRWLRSPDARPSPYADPRPPVQPPSRIPVKHMAVMAGHYRADLGWRTLPEAEAEATALARTYGAALLEATQADLDRLLDARLPIGDDQVGGADAMHFAGHGAVGAQPAEGGMLILSDGQPLPSVLFVDARYGGTCQPLLFLNACMLGAGGELLGEVGGFPGNCLQGGFGALVGALWEIDDAVAHECAMTFWERAMPTDGGAPVAIGEILRDLRARFVASGQAPPAHTWLAYVYYGHPRLTLQRVA